MMSDMLERQILSGLLSRCSRFRLFVAGDIGAKEIDGLIRVLELQKELLSDDEADG